MDSRASPQSYWIWKWGLAICILTSLLGDSDAKASFGITGLAKPYALWSNQSIYFVPGFVDCTDEKSWCYLGSRMKGTEMKKFSVPIEICLEISETCLSSQSHNPQPLAPCVSCQKYFATLQTNRRSLVSFTTSNEHTWSKSYIHALQKGIGGIGAGLNASRRRKISFLKGLYMTFGQVHVVLEYM